MTLSTSLSKDSIRRAFDRARDTYAKAAKVQAEVALKCAGHVPEGEYPAVIEIGAGGGVLTRHIASRCQHDRYVAVDISPEMLSQVNLRMLSNPELVMADAECLKLSQDSFDLLVSSSTMQWYHSPEVTIHDNLKLLRNGGFFSLSIFVEGTYAEFAKASAATGFGSMLPMRPAEFFIEILQDAHVTDVQWEQTSYTCHYASASDMLRAHRSTGATATGGDKQPSKSAYKEFINYLERFRVTDGIPSTSSILYLWGRR
ncbi:methyltransferase domain-containing protein [Pseudodesulfovibrio sp. zrk46]|uniref:methyltransferase domain-containing protein n=1 Tax=Pseudodesulfovibrio sp. zrk46 TaxID=2725288 RepID=UPI001449B050|nr:methyltransferase domain-containing protein [Pseudodesulfovibrio sp. zrk46]QJB55203.1 methyltransferase domain-containing protein [Pseudodesulfovibrio sp. zrk46]